MTAQNKERSDEALAAEVSSGNHAAFEQLVKKHARTFYRAAYRITLSQEEAEDIVQEAFLKLLDGRAAWQDGKGARFSTWFYRIVCNQAVSHVRKKTSVALDETMLEENESERPDMHLQEKEAASSIEEALSALTPQQRMAVELFYYAGLSQKEASEMMQITVKAYESLLSRAKAGLKEELKHYA